MSDKPPKVKQDDIEASSDVFKLTEDSTIKEIEEVLDRLNKVPYWRWQHSIDKEPLSVYDPLSKELLEKKDELKYIISRLGQRQPIESMKNIMKEQNMTVKKAKLSKNKFEKRLASLKRMIEEADDDDYKGELIFDRQRLLRERREMLKESTLSNHGGRRRTRRKLRAKSRKRSKSRKRRRKRRKSRRKKRRRKKRTKRRR